MEDIKQQLQLLSGHGVEFVIVGGVAAALHGSSIPTYDLDVCYARSTSNLDRLAEAMTAVHATLRGAPQGLPFTPNRETLRSGLNFTFDTDVGPLDLLGEVLGVGGFVQARENAASYQLFGQTYLVLALDKLGKSCALDIPRFEEAVAQPLRFEF